MLRKLAILLIVVALIPLAIAENPFSVAKSGEVLVKVKSGASIQSLAISSQFTIKASANPQLKVVRFVTPQGQDQYRHMNAMLEDLNNDPQVEYAHPNYYLELLETMPNDPKLSQQYMIRILSLNSAWDKATGKNNIVVAILDTGFDVNHEDLKANLWKNTKEIPGNKIDDDKNGYIDDVHGWDFVANKPIQNDVGGHGTSCAGLIGAVGNNGIGIAGVAWNVSLMPLHIIESQAAVINAINAAHYAVDNGARILSNSWRIYGHWSQYWKKYPPRALSEAIDYVGTKNGLWVNAAGNENNDIDNVKTYPPNWNKPHMIKVAASDSSDRKASFSSYGPKTVDLAAPGVGVLTTKNRGGYKPFSGTSAACPVVSGVAALVLANNPNLTAVELRKVLNESVDPISDFYGKLITSGRINAQKAISHPLVASSVAASSASVLNNGNQVFDLNKSVIGIIRGNRVIDASGEFVGAIRGTRLVDAKGKFVGVIRGNRIANSSQNVIGRLKGKEILDAKDKLVATTNAGNRGAASYLLLLQK